MITAKDVQHVIDVQAILTDHGVEDIKPELIATLIDWKTFVQYEGADANAPATKPAAAAPKPASTTKGTKTVSDDEPAF